MRKIRTAAAASILGLGLSLALTPVHAETTTTAPDCQFSDVQLSETTVAVGIRDTVTVYATGTATGCEADQIGLLYAGSVTTSGLFTPSPDDPTQWTGFISIAPADLINEDAGTSEVSVYVNGAQSIQDVGVSLTIKRRSRMGAGGMPHKIKKNKRFGFGAGLDLVSWTDGWYTANQGKKVHLQTKSMGGKYKTYKTIRSMRGQNGGSLSATIKLKKTTCFRWVFNGSSTTSAATDYAGCVKVKK